MTKKGRTSAPITWTAGIFREKTLAQSISKKRRTGWMDGKWE